MAAKKRFVERAKLLGDKVSSHPKLVWVGATLDPTEFSRDVFEEGAHVVGCSSCGLEYASNLPQSNCPNCGNQSANDMDPDAVPEDALEQFPDDSQLAAIQCPSCKTHNIITEHSSVLMGGHMFCSVCATAIDYAKPVLARSDGVFDGDNEGDTNNVTSDERPGIMKQGDKVSQTIAPGNRLTGGTPQGIEKPVDSDVNDFLTDEIYHTDSNDDAGATASVRLLDVASTSKGMEFLASEDRIYLMLGELTVASLSVDKAGEAKSIFATPKMMTVLATHAKNGGLEQVLAAYDWEYAHVNFPFKATIQKQVQSEVASVQRNYSTRVAELEESFEQSLAIAAAGMTRSFFKGMSNPIRTGLIQELAAAGMHNPEALVDRVLASYSDSYHQELLAKAKELKDKPIELRNSLAEAISEVSPRTSSETASFATNANFGQRLEQAAVEAPAEVRQAIKSANGAKASRIQEIRSSLGGSVFSRNLSSVGG